MRLSAVIFTTLALCSNVHAEGPWPGSSPDCWNEPRNYHASEEVSTWQKHVTVNRVPKSKELADEIFSKNNGYSFTLSGSRPDFELLIDAEKDHLLKLTFTDTFGLHEVSWINENLISVRAWWGRRKGTDLIINVESESFVYDETVINGTQAYMQHKTGCSTYGCKCIPKE